ncbi:MAG: TetR/AcrR family transcriptional regulator [Halieaceae bacterium]|nr:TetR/AcrR family transcriptional regulator [Halieaceae bacterium]
MPKPTPKIGGPQRLIAAAEQELIANHGHMEIAAVARRAGVSVGLAYHHFGSKTGLMAAVVDAFYEPIREIALGDGIPVDLEWGAREKARMAGLVDYYFNHPLAPLIAGRLAREPEVQDVERAHMDALLEAGARNIAQGQKLGVVNPDLEPHTTVAMLMGGIHLVIDRALIADQRPSRDEFLEQFWRLVSNALQLDNTHTATTGGHANVREL